MFRRKIQDHQKVVAIFTQTFESFGMLGTEDIAAIIERFFGAFFDSNLVSIMDAIVPVFSLCYSYQDPLLIEFAYRFLD